MSPPTKPFEEEGEVNDLDDAGAFEQDEGPSTVSHTEIDVNEFENSYHGNHPEECTSMYMSQVQHSAD